MNHKKGFMVLTALLWCGMNLASMKALRVGILGAGFMGHTHGQRLVKRGGVSLAGICDVAPGAAAALKDKLGATDTTVFDSFDRMLAEAKLDALYVCLPPFAHAGQVEQAAGRGIHLFLEKPIALTVPAAEKMVAAIEKAGVVSQVGYHLRFRRCVERFRQLIATGQAGTPTLFEGRYWCRMPNQGWWPDITKSGGQLVEQVIHIYDLAMHLFGPAESVIGYAPNLAHTGAAGYSIEDTSAGLVRFKNGAVASITGSNCALPVHFLGDWRAVCDRAMLEYRTTGQFWVKPDESTVFTHDGDKVARAEFTEDADVSGAETDDFLNAIRTGGQTRSPARDGLNSLKLVAAVLESARQGGLPVKL